MNRIYVAGKLSDSDLDYLTNVRNMVYCADDIMRLGLSIYVPAWDIIHALIIGNKKYDNLFNNSQPWLEVSDAMFVTPGWEESKGTKREMETARQKNIPIFYERAELKKYAIVKGWIK